MELSYTVETDELQAAINKAAEKELRAQIKRIPTKVREATSRAVDDLIQKEIASITDDLRAEITKHIAKWPDNIPERVEQAFVRCAQDAENSIAMLDQSIADQVKGRASAIEHNVLYTLLSVGFAQTDPETGEQHHGTFLDHLARHMK